MNHQSNWRSRGRRVAPALIVLAVALALGAGAYRLRQVEAAASLTTAPAKKGEFLVIVRCRGELRARRSVQIIAPADVPQLRIVWMEPPGSRVRAGQPVVRFDPSRAEQQLQEKEAALKQAQASLEEAIAQARITAEKDKVDLAQARYQVERARLEASKQEIVSAIQGEESRIDLRLAEENLLVQEATVALHEASAKAKIASLTTARDQAQAEVDLTRQRLALMELKAPLEGLIVYLPNYSQGWMNAKPFKVGDQVWPGAALAEIPDLNTLEMEGKIEETDRGKVVAGQDVLVQVDSLPEKTFPARLGQVSLLTEQNFEWPPSQNFRGYAAILTPDQRLRPAMNGKMDIVVQRLPEAISIPAQSLFTYNSKPVVYVAKDNTYIRKEVEVLARNPDEVAVSGIDAGSMVTLSEPGNKGQGR